MNISSAAKATGLTSKAIRYYEEIGLLSPAKRRDNGYREYSQAHLTELGFIQHSRELGFTLEECKSLLELWQNKDRKSADVKQMAEEKILDMNKKIQQLTQMRDSLKSLTQCCKGNDRPDCPIIEGLAKAD
ncbi:Cu(I)-responsive transcriptional regulator [Pelagibaculum spongiae]|uniref:Cu(I)-responsive transcriptional regulator n=1 Tax=Pelagibaculum spongiae TaxID=2080658 RepID=A0A2V1H1V2_9GAMM|nr:Cu(I)-responsive transcriptional regulator [Pelagibaculum spongiae]PVZ72513.1 Cu(I)-responsive transcriptional regulator [Pelagibaculum spongiae]